MPKFTTRQLFMLMVLVGLGFANLSNQIRVPGRDAKFGAMALSVLFPGLICVWAFAWARMGRNPSQERRDKRPLRYRNLIIKFYGIAVIVGLLIMIYVNLASQLNLLGPSSIGSIMFVVAIIATFIGSLMVIVSAMRLTNLWRRLPEKTQ